MCVLVFWREGITAGEQYTVLLPGPGLLWLEPGKEAEPDKRLTIEDPSEGG